MPLFKRRAPARRASTRRSPRRSSRSCSSAAASTWCSSQRRGRAGGGRAAVVQRHCRSGFSGEDAAPHPAQTATRSRSPPACATPRSGARSPSGRTTLLLPRRIRRRVRPRIVLRPRGAGARPPQPRVRPQPGRGHAGGVLKPWPGQGHGRRPPDRRAPTRCLAEEALEDAAGRGPGRPRARTRSQILRGDETTWARVLEARAPARCSRRSRAVVVRNADALKGEGEEVAGLPRRSHPGSCARPAGRQARQAARRRGSASWSRRAVTPAEPLEGARAAGARGRSASAPAEARAHGRRRSTSCWSASARTCAG